LSQSISKSEEGLQEILEGMQDKLKEYKQLSEKDLQIDEFELDTALLDTPKLYSKWIGYHSDETVLLKNLYGYKEEVKLERWKYYQGKQTNEYYAKNGLVHDKILKTDIDKYLGADSKLNLVNDIIAIQKAIVDLIEKTSKECSNRGFHIKNIIEWRKFTQMG